MARWLFLLLNLVALVIGQGSVAPAITGSAAPSACGGCYVIAGVAAVVFGEELVQTATQVVSVGIGKNGTTVTTSYAVPGVEFSFNPSGLLTGSEPGPTFAPGTVITISGATLTSPTAYNVFTALSETSLVPSNGQCVTSAVTTSTLSSAYLVPIPANAGPNFIYEAEISFINHIGGLTCAPGGVQVSSTTQTPIGTTTQTQTVTGPLRPTPIAQSTVASSTASVTAEVTTSAAAATGTPATTVVPFGNATATVIVGGSVTSILTGTGASATYVPFTGAADAILPLPTLAAAMGFAVPGLFAWLL